MIYMDYSATTPLALEVKEKMMAIMDNNFGNPSSMHKLGVESEKIIKASRQTLSKILKATPEEIYFTSGGTESNNIAIQGICKRHRSKGNHIITTEFEHPSVRSTFQLLENEGFEVTYIPILQDGTLDEHLLLEAVTDKTILVSVMHVNNEIGTINDIDSLSKKIKQKNGDIFIHVDAVQSFGKFPINLKRLKVDLLSFSAHKIYGPKGTGGLYVKKGCTLSPLIIGGQQEKAIRPGTENLIGIGAFGTAGHLSSKEMKISLEKVASLRNLFIKCLKEGNIDFQINTNMEVSSPYILNITFLRMRGEVLLHTLESEGVYVSTGSACSSKKKDYSHVLKALGYDAPRMEGAIRFSFSPMMTEDMVQEASKKVVKSVLMLEDIIKGR